MSFGKGDSQAANLIPMNDETPRPSLFARPSYRLFSISQPAPDPDDNQVVWQEQEAYSAMISRQEHPRDPSALLSLRDVLRKPPTDNTSALSSSRFTNAGTRPSAWAQPAVEINMQSADGQLEALEMKGAAGRILRDIDTVHSRSTSRNTSRSITPTLSTFEGQICRDGASSVESSVKQSDVVSKFAENETLQQDRISTIKDKSDPPTSGSYVNTNTPSHFLTPSSFTNTISYMMKYVLNASEPRPGSSGLNIHHGLLSLDTSTIDERPHIKYDWTIGKRLKFSCTVYYAKQFDALRRRCNVDDVFLRSMERSDNWMAEGGKSKSNFWKTTDDRFIIKTLVNAWNVADL
jgi:1-phosphatidylinositol-3-phosphate 5-kinase